MPPGLSIEQPDFLRQPLVEPKTNLPSGCAICDTKEDLKICTGCRVVSYCGRDHQVEHRKEHKGLCKYAEQTQATIRAIGARLGPHHQEPSLPNVPRLLTDG